MHPITGDRPCARRPILPILTATPPGHEANGGRSRRKVRFFPEPTRLDRDDRVGGRRRPRSANYKVFVQDYDIPLGASFVGAMHNGIKIARGLIILFSSDYERSPYTRKEFTSFEAERLQNERERHIVHMEIS
jgi:TIR domain